jgi:ketosteroid isomerase-like protein
VPVTAVDLIRQGFDAFNRGDFGVIVDLVAEDIEYDMSETLDVGVIHGRHALRTFFEGLDERWASFQADVDDIVAGRESVVALVTWRFTARRSNVPVQLRHAQVWSFENGVAVRMRLFLDRSEALRAAGLSE